LAGRCNEEEETIDALGGGRGAGVDFEEEWRGAGPRAATRLAAFTAFTDAVVVELVLSPLPLLLDRAEYSLAALPLVVTLTPASDLATVVEVAVDFVTRRGEV